MQERQVVCCRNLRLESPFSFERLRERRALLSAPCEVPIGQGGVGPRIEQKPYDGGVASGGSTNQRSYIAGIALVDVRARLEQEANHVNVVFFSSKNKR